MIARDRELLSHLGIINRRLGEAVVELLHHQDGGELPADGLSALAEHLQEAANMCRTRAGELHTTHLANDDQAEQAR